MKNIKNDNSQTIIKDDNKSFLSASDIIKFYTPEFMAFKTGKPLTLTEDVIAKILVYPSKGIFTKKTICSILGINIKTMDTWFLNGNKDIDKNKVTIYSVFVQCWEKAIALHYIKRKEIINNAIEGKEVKGNISLAIREIEKYHYEREGFSNNGKSISLEQSQQTTTMEVSKNGTVKVTKEMKQARLMMNDYIDNVLDTYYPDTEFIENE